MPHTGFIDVLYQVSKDQNIEVLNKFFLRGTCKVFPNYSEAKATFKTN